MLLENAEVATDFRPELGLSFAASQELFGYLILWLALRWGFGRKIRIDAPKWSSLAWRR